MAWSKLKFQIGPGQFQIGRDFSLADVHFELATFLSEWGELDKKLVSQIRQVSQIMQIPLSST